MRRQIEKRGGAYDKDGNKVGEVTVETIIHDDGHQDAIVHVAPIVVKIARPNA